MENEQMNEETTQTEAESTGIDFSNIFVDAEADTKPIETKKEEVTEPTEEKTDTETDTKPSEQLIKVKYNGKEMEIPISEVTALVQKGMNYDHIKEEADNLKNSKALKAIDIYAKQNGIDRDAYAEYLMAEAEKSEQLKYEAEGIPTEFAKKMAETEKNAATMAEKLKVYEEKEAKGKQWTDFYAVDDYKSIDVNKLPQEVLDAVAKGETPLNAYRAWELQDVKNKLKTIEQAQRTKEKSVGSASAETASEKHDAFLDGLMGK